MGHEFTTTCLRLVQLLDERAPEVMCFADELPSMRAASVLDTQALAQDLALLRRSFHNAQEEVRKARAEPGSELFCEAATDFLVSAMLTHSIQQLMPLNP